ncbi:MAG: type IV pilus assembly protein PilM [bacterium]|nr:type IV pilus assembly protein PilM [bacterium]
MKFNDHFGLDIGTSEIKIVYLNQAGNSFKLVSFGVAKLPNFEEAADIIRKIIKDLNISTKRVMVSLPEAQVYTRVIETPVLSDTELENAIRWEAEQYVPIPLTDVLLRHQILAKPDKITPESKMDVLLVAAPNTVIEKYMKICQLAGLELIGIETEILAVSRALVGNDPYSPTSLIVSFGGVSTDLAVVKKVCLSFVRSLSTGGDAVTRAVMSDLKMDENQAEEYKRNYGMDATQLDGKVNQAIGPVMDTIVAEIKRAIAFYQSKKPDDPIKRAVLVGGMAKMPGLVNYLAQSLTLEVQISNPFANIVKTEKQSQSLGDNLPVYATAVGLALKEG